MQASKKTKPSAYQVAEDEYLGSRQQLKTMTDQRPRLVKQRAATLAEAEQAGSEWRQLFRDSMGQPSDDVRKLKAAEFGGHAEVEQLTEMLSELDASIVATRKAAKKARKTYVDAHRAAQIAGAAAELESAAKAVLETEAGQALVEAIGQKRRAARYEVLGCNATMAGLGFANAAENGDPAFMARITTADRDAIQRKADSKVASDLAGLFAMPEAKENRDHGQVVPALACEA